MVVGGKAKVGPILGLVGSALLLIAGFIAFGVQALLEATMFPLTWADIGMDPMILTVRAVLTVIFALVALIGAILGLLGKKIGVILMLIFGIITTVGMFVPIGTITIGFTTIPVSMNYNMFFIDPILILLGGILGLALKE